MIKTLTVAFLALSIGVLFVQTEHVQTQKDLTEWAAALGHSDYAVREDAMGKLRAAGESARTVLKGLKTSPVLEQRARAEQLLSELDEPPRSEALKPSQGVPRGLPGVGGFTSPRVQVFGGTEPLILDDLLKLMRESASGMDPLVGLPRIGGSTLRPSHSGETARILDLLQLALPPGAVQSKTQMSFDGPDGQGSIEQDTDGSIRVDIDGEKYEAPSLDVLRKDRPELYEKMKRHGFDAPGLHIRTFGSGTPFSGWQALPRDPVSPGVSPFQIEPEPILEGRTLGVVLGDVPDLLREHLSLPVHALVIESVKPDSAARSAGIRAKDLLLEVDGKPAKSFDSVRETLKDSESKLEVSVKILRQGKEQTLSVRWPESK
jgi:hypothetical protein